MLHWILIWGGKTQKKAGGQSHTMPILFPLSLAIFFIIAAFLFSIVPIIIKSISIFNLSHSPSPSSFNSLLLFFIAVSRPQRHSVIFHIIWLLLLFAQSLHSSASGCGGREGLKACEHSEIEMKLNSREHRQWHLFNHVLFWVFFSLSLIPVIRSLGALPFNERYLICEVNWHVFIRHHVIKSNLRHPRFIFLLPLQRAKNILSFIKILNFI